MADTKVSALTADASPSGDDLLYVVNDPGGTPAGRKVTIANLEASLDVLNMVNAPAEASADVTDATNVAAAGAIMDSDFSTNGIMVRTGAATYSIITDSSSDWDTAFGWGDHASAGYLTDIVSDTTPQLGGMLDVNGQSLGDGTLELLKFSETLSAVNEVTVANAATGNGPTISATGDDTNIDLNLAGKGSGVVNAGGNRVLTTADEGSGNGIDADTLDGAEGAAYALLSTLASTANGDGAALVGIEDSGGLITATTVEGALAENRAAIDALEAATHLDNVVEDTSPQLGGQLDVNGNAIGNGTEELIEFSETASAVNHIDVTNAATGNAPSVRATGDDANVDLIADGKGTGNLTDASGNRYLTTADEGTGNGIDADTLDGVEGSGYVQTSVQVIAGDGLSDGGALSGNVTINVDIQGQTENASPATSDWVLVENNAGGTFRKVQLTNLPGGGGGLSNVVEDTTPQLGGDLDTNGSNIVAANGDGLLTGTTAGNTLLLGAYDVDGAAYTTFATLTANNTPTMDLNTAVTIDSDYIVRVNPSPSDNEVATFNGTTGLVDGNAGFTYDPTARLYVRTFTAPTSTVELPLRVSANSSGTAANGYGAGIDIYADNAAATEVQIGTLEWAWTDATDTTEDSDIKLYGYTAGTKTEYMHLDGANQLVDLPTGWQFAIDGTPLSTGGLGNVVEDTTPQLGGQLDVNGNALGDGTLELLSFTETPSAVNQINVTNNSTGNAPILGVAGDDTNIDLVLAGKGSGVPKIGSAAILVSGGDLGTPSAGVATNLTGTASGLTAGAVSTITGLAPDTATTQATQPNITSAANLATVGTVTTGTWNATAVAAQYGGTGLNTSASTGIPQVASGTWSVSTSLPSGTTLVAPVLGTPASGTLTNCTGLPVSGITASTSTALGVGSIELGHATDTTLSRASAGNLAVEGTLVKKVGAETIWVPATAMTARTTSGAASGSAESTTNKVMLETFDFDAATDEFVQFSVAFPKSWNGSTVQMKFFWSNASGTGDVVWSAQAMALADSDVLDTAFGTAQSVTDSVTTAGDLMVSGNLGTALTIAGTPGDDEMVTFQVYRDADNGSDTLAGDARLHGVKIIYTTDAANDD